MVQAVSGGSYRMGKKSENENPSFLQEAPRTVLFPDSSVSGKLSFNIPVKIDSQFTGEVIATELLVLGPNAEVEARIAARDLQVEGKLDGNVCVSGWIQIMPGGRFRGKIEAGRLRVHPGGEFDGIGEVSNGHPSRQDHLPRPSLP
jgi:cytoskeletal protein CcmA (bactofilin family)